MTHQKPTKLLKGFTLVEVLIVVAIIAVLTIAILLVLNPMEYLKQSRDAVRLQDIGNLFKTLNYIKADSPQTYFGESNKVYVSLPDPNINSGTSTCSGINLPSLPNGWQYQCVSKNTLQNIDGTGWIPVDFSRQSIFRLNKLPIDPKNDLDNYYVYTYDPQSDKFELGSILESEKYQNLASNDNGDNPNIYESGTDLSLYPISSIGGNFALKNESNQSVKNESNSLIYVAQAASNGQVTFFIGSDQATGDNNLYWDNTNKMLGIGTASPAQTLHVQGNAYFSGNVGIGTTNPSAKLDVLGNINLSTGSKVAVNVQSSPGSGFVGIDFTDNSFKIYPRSNTNHYLNISTDGTLYLQNVNSVDIGLRSSNSLVKVSSGAIQFFVNNLSTEKIRIDSSGNIGIGTTNPTYKLHVDGGSNNTVAYFTGTGITRVGINAPSNTGFGLYVGGSQKWSNAVYQQSGTGSNLDYTIWNEQTNSAGIFIDGDTNNVGVGTTNPTSKLYVAGDLTVTGTKNFEADYPGDPTKKIIYVALEGPEAGTYIRGTSVCENFETTINFPDYFSLVTVESGLSASLTPRGSFSNLYIKELTNEHLIVGCETGKSFDYIVFGIRKGYENFNPIKQK